MISIFLDKSDPRKLWWRARLMRLAADGLPQQERILRYASVLEKRAKILKKRERRRYEKSA